MVEGQAAPVDELAEAWVRLAALFADRRDAMFDLLREHDLTPPHSFALSALLPGPMRMRDLADLMVCDASYITAITDRLEQRGLVERRTDHADRRVKEIALTATGEALGQALRATITTPPPEFARLSAAEQHTLAALLRRVVPDVELAPGPFPRRSGATHS